jgi:hypothetical protein
MANQHTRLKAQEGLVCYNCEVNEPERNASGQPIKDEFGGYSCKPCKQAVAAMRELYRLDPLRGQVGGDQRRHRIGKDC